MNKVMFHYYIEPKVIPDLLTEDEIEYLKKESIDKLEPSTTGVNCVSTDKSIRKSESAWLDPNDPIMNNITRKCISHIDKPIGHCENLQVVRYKEGGYYVPHQDALFIDDCHNDRLYSFIIALNDDYEGGETLFANLDIKYKLKKGSVLFFHTSDNYEFETNMALHSGEPVKSGEKWICNLWVHKFPIVPRCDFALKLDP